ncbi:MAG: DNA polymerase III subunit gamma/tau [Chloroflexota bacterium]
MSQALYRKWRPKTWEAIVGQQHVVQTLRNAVTGNRVAHAYLFAGPRGTGKTSAARLLAKAVNCLADDLATRPCNQCAHCQAVNEGRFLDLIEIDAASQTGVDDVRDLRDKINFAPNQGAYKVYIIDEVHMFSTSAFNALLKTLEEPPPHAIFVLATTEIHKIPATVLSRCQRHEFRRVPVNEIIAQLEMIAKTENLQAEPAALTLIARQATGSLRDAISMLDQLASTGPDISLALAETVLGTATSQTVIQLVDAVLDRDPGAGLDAIHRALDSGTDARILARQVVDYLRTLLLVQLGNASLVDVSQETLTQVKRQAGALSPSGVVDLIQAFNKAAADLRGGWQPALALEMALAEVLASALETQVEPTREAKPKGRASPERMLKQEQSPPQKESAAQHKPKAAPTGTPVARLEMVIKVWQQVRATIRPDHPSLDGLLNSCALLEVKDGVLVLGFASDVLRSKMDVPEQVETVCAVLEQQLGQKVGLRCIVSNAKQSTPANVKPDGMVAAALKAGGEIVDIQD